ncbi:efflux RND transporter periplasmic adaptor subunit [Cupriavidus necator]
MRLQTVSAVAAALPGQTLTGKVDAILPDINTGTRTIKVRSSCRTRAVWATSPGSSSPETHCSWEPSAGRT